MRRFVAVDIHIADVADFLRRRAVYHQAQGHFDKGVRLGTHMVFQQQYAILARNERFGKNEIDAICRKKNDLVFCEVKTRTAPPDIPSPYGTAAAAVNAEKQKHLIAAAKAYLRRFPQTSRIRFDVIEVYGEEGAAAPRIRQIENAFGG